MAAMGREPPAEPAARIKAAPHADAWRGDLGGVTQVRNPYPLPLRLAPEQLRLTPRLAAALGEVLATGLDG
jgi:hypothetical protein